MENQENQLNNEQMPEVVLDLEKKPEVEWHFVENNEPVGPHSESDMAVFIQTGRINPKTYVWKNGLTEWVLLEDSDLNRFLAMESEPETLNSSEPQNGQDEPAVRNDSSLDWYYVENGTSVGPYSEDYMISLIRQGVLTPVSYVWNQNLKDWTLLKQTDLAQYCAPTQAYIAGQVSNAQHKQQSTASYVAPGTVQPRNIALFLVLSLITCGIFSLVWYYLLGESVNTLARKYGQQPAMEPVLALILSIVTCGLFGLYYLWKLADVLSKIRINGRTTGNNALLVLILAFLIQPVALCVLQDQVNQICASE